MQQIPGFMLFLSREPVCRLDTTVEEGFKMIFSAGIAVPESGGADSQVQGP